MQSRLTYCCSTWAAWEPRGNKVLLQRLQAVCNKFFRLIFNLGRNDSVRGLLKSNDILDIYQNYDFDIYKHMHKAVNGESPKPVQKMLGLSNDFFYFKTPRIQQTKKSIHFAGPHLWNTIPLGLNLTQEPNFSNFKNQIKQYIINK